jgi:hypothetical protein
MFQCENTGIDRFLNVEKFTITPLSLPISCNLSCPTVGLKILLPMYTALYHRECKDVIYAAAEA